MRGIIKKKKSKELRNKGTLTGQNSRGEKKKKKSLQEKLKKKEKKVSILIWFITEKKIV